MEQKTIKVLIGDNTAEKGVKLASQLRSDTVYTYTRSRDVNSLVSSIINDSPDIVITPLTLPDSDALLLIKEVQGKLRKAPAFVVISDIDNSFIRRQVLSSGAVRFFTDPLDISELTKFINDYSGKYPVKYSKDIEITVTDKIRSLGVPANIKGYHYLRTAIINAVYDNSLMDSITKLLYPSVAIQYSTTSSRVERSIRHAIVTAWERGNTDDFRKLFGCTANDLPVRPTNSEFIALITDMMRLKFKEC